MNLLFLITFTYPTYLINSENETILQLLVCVNCMFIYLLYILYKNL